LIRGESTGVGSLANGNSRGRVDPGAGAVIVAFNEFDVLPVDDVAVNWIGVGANEVVQFSLSDPNESGVVREPESVAPEDKAPPSF
jgi:hypothetical protein